MRRRKWTDDHDKELTKLAGQGLFASQIAIRLNTMFPDLRATKNAVIARAIRIEVPLQNRPTGGGGHRRASEIERGEAERKQKNADRPGRRVGSKAGISANRPISLGGGYDFTHTGKLRKK